MSGHTLKAQTLGGVKWTTVSSVIVTLCQLATLVILARFLAPEDFGLMAILMVVVGFCQVFMDAGISFAIIQRKEISHTQLSSLYWLNIVAGIMLCGAVYLLAPFIAAFYERSDMTGMIRLLSLVFIIISIGNQYRILCQKELQFSRMAMAETAAAFGSLIVAVLSAIAGYGVFALIFGMMTQASLSSFIFLFIGLKYHHRPALIYKHSELKGFFSFGLYQMGDRAMNYLNTHADNLLIGKFLGMEALGFYNLAWQLCVFPVLRINPILNKVAFPVFSKLQDDEEKRALYYANFMRVAGLIIIPLMVFLFFFATPIVNIVYGQGWEVTASLAAILAAVGIIKAIGAPGGALFLSLGRADIGFWWNGVWLIGIAGTVLTTLLIAPSIENVAYAVLGITLAFALIWHLMIVRITKTPYRALLKHLLRGFAVSVLIGCAALAITKILGLENEIAILALGGVICAALYLPYLFFFERDLIDSYRKQEV